MPLFADSLDMSAAPLQGLLAARRGSRRHAPAMMFAAIAIAVATAALLSPSRASLTLPGGGNPGFSSDSASGKGPRLAVASETELVCRGQAWGAESEACLEVIARESGRGGRVKVRLIALGAPEATTPNVL